MAQLRGFLTFCVGILYFARSSSAVDADAKRADNKVQSIRQYHYSHPESVLRCGEVLNNTKGIISYRPFEPVLPNERCVWIIRSPWLSHHSIQVRNMGIDSSVEITALTYGQEKTSWLALTNSYQQMSANILVITFQTNGWPQESNAAGFTIFYENWPVFDYGTTGSGWYPTTKPAPTASSTTPAQEDVITTGWGDASTWAPTQTTYSWNLPIPVTQSSDAILSASSGYLRYPPNSYNYDNYEHSVMIITPSNNLRSPSISVVYKEIGIEDCCDGIDVYQYNANTFPRWNLVGRISGRQNLEFIQNDDMIMLVFQSDMSVTGGGFELTHTQCS